MYFFEVLPAGMNGHAIARKGWKSKGMFVYSAIVKSSEVFQSDSSDAILHNVNGLQAIPILALKAADNTITFGWNANQSDMLANDWDVLTNEQLVEIKEFGRVLEHKSAGLRILNDDEIPAPSIDPNVPLDEAEPIDPADAEAKNQANIGDAPDALGN